MTASARVQCEGDAQGVSSRVQGAKCKEKTQKETDTETVKELENEKEDETKKKKKKRKRKRRCRGKNCLEKMKRPFLSLKSSLNVCGEPWFGSVTQDQMQNCSRWILSMREGARSGGKMQKP